MAEPRYIKLNASGDAGRHGANGHRGGGRGAHGSNAGPAQSGGDAGNVDLTLATSGDDARISWALSNTQRSKAKSLSASASEVINLTAYGGVTTRAVGGAGGRGGKGGDGSQGTTGRKGRDATKSSSGEDGGPGGRGGNAGAGTDGANAGRGGQVILFVPGPAPLPCDSLRPRAGPTTL